MGSESGSVPNHISHSSVIWCHDNGCSVFNVYYVSVVPAAWICGLLLLYEVHEVRK